MVTYASLLVVVLYLFATIFMSYVINRRTNAGGDFAKGRQNFHWLVAGISILATYVSAMTFIGMPGWVYQEGMTVMAIHLNYPWVIIFSALFFIPVFYKLGLTSIYEYLELRFGVATRVINAFIFILVQCVSAGIILYSVALIFIQFIPISIYEAIIYLSIFTGIYTFAGGITTVIWTDVLQSLVLLVGTVAIFTLLLFDNNLMASLDPEKLQVMDFDLNLFSDTTVLSGLFAVSFLHISVYGSNQLIIQRTLTTRNVKHATKAMLFCGYGAFIIYFIFALLGVFLHAFYQGQAFTNANEVILNFVFNHTNEWVIGVIIAALTAAAMSTLDSTYNSIATVVSSDIYKRFIKPEATSRDLDRVARKLSFAVAVLVVFPAIFAVSNESVLKSIASFISIVVGIRLGAFILGFFVRSATEHGLLVGSVASIISVALARYSDLAWPWYAPIGTIVFLIFAMIASRYLGDVSKAQLDFFETQKGLFEKPSWAHYNLLIFAGCTLVFCFYLPEIVSFIL